MAILQRVALLPNQRFDTPDARAIEAYSLNDWRYFLQGFMADQSYVLTGFEVSNYATVFLVAGIKIKVSEVALFHSEATTQASGFYVSSGTESDISVSLSSSATNFIECDLTTLSGTPDVRAFWDQAANGGAGAEYTDTIDTVNNLEITITSNISGFTPGKIPLYKAVTDTGGVVTTLTDCRNLFFRLGTGGNSPNPLADYSWPAVPDLAHSRLENAVSTSTATATNQPFLGGDKNLKTFKDWMDAVMTSIKEIKGTPFWYQAAAGGSGAGSVPGAYQNSALTVLVGGTWEHNQTTLGHLILTGGSSIYRLGFNNNCSMSAFLDVDLTAQRVFYIILPSTDTAVTYGFGDDASTPVTPKTISSLTASTITVPTGGNYVSGGGTIMAAGQEYAYTSYTPGTGVFSGVSPDPTLVLAPGIDVYQLNSGATGYYHYSVSSKVPGRTGATSEGAERVIWLAVYDGSSVIQLKNGDLQQGEQINVGDNTSLNVLSYMGSPGEAATQPSYSTQATGSKTGTTSYNSTAGENLTVRASKLTSMMADKAQDKTIQTVQRNITNVVNTTNGANQDITFTSAGIKATYAGSVPGMSRPVSLEAVTAGVIGNSILLAFNGTLTITAAIAAWNLANPANTVILLGGDGAQIPNNAQTITLSGGLNSATQELTVFVPGSSNNGSIVLTGTLSLAANQTAYFSIDRNAAFSVANLAGLTVVATASVPVGENIFVFAQRGSDNTVYLWDGSRLNVGSWPAYQILSQSVWDRLGIVGESQFSPYKSFNYLTPAQSLPDAISSIDSEMGKFFGQLKLVPHPSNASRVKITGVDKTLLDSAILSQEITSLFMDFDGAEIDFQSGNIFASDGVTALGINFTPFTIPVSQYFWYGIAIIPNSVTAINKITAQVLITPAASANAVQSSAPLPPIAGTKKVGAVLIRNVAGTATVTSVRQLGVGSGSGSGTGDANEVLERLKEGWNDTLYDYMTPNVFSINETDLIDTVTPGASTGSFEVVTSTYVMNVAQKLTSLQMLDADFLVSGRDLEQIDLFAYYSLANIDTLGTFEVSRDGGNNWQTISGMARVSPQSDLIRGTHIFSIEPSNNSLKTWPVANETTSLALVNSGAGERRGQKITLTSAVVAKRVTLYLNKTGSPSGILYAQIVKDSSGVPSTNGADVLSQSSAVQITTLSTGNISVDFNFDATVLPAGVYHIVVFGDANYDASYSAGVTQIAVRVDGAAPVDEASSSFNGTTWTAIPGQTLTYILLGRALDLRVRITSGTAGSKLTGYGILYAPGGGVVNEKLEQETFSFSGDFNINTFTISQFLPNPKNLKVYWKKTGRVFIWDDFSVDGQLITFPANTFNLPGENITLLFDQTQGALVDTSDSNSTSIAVIQSQNLDLRVSNLEAQQPPKNYIANAKFTSVTLGVPTSWGTFKTTVSGKIPTGGILTAADVGFTIARTTTTPLEGIYSGLLSWAGPGALAIGNGLISAAFTIDREDRAKVMGFSFYYEAVSGTMDFSGTSNNTWAVYIYAVDGTSGWIQPAGVYNLTQSSGVGLCSGTFQTTADSTQYRIAILCVTATSGAVSLEIDDFQLGPQKIVSGPSGPVGEIIATGSLTAPVGFLYCNGASVSTSQYQDLFNVIGYTYGGSGGNFNLPDLRGVFPRGAGSQTIGAETYSTTLGTKQNDATSRNGLTATATTSTVSGTIGNTDLFHLHQMGSGATATAAGGSFTTPNYDAIGPARASEGPDRSLNHSHSFSGTAAAQTITINAGDAETRPANVAVAYHIRYLATYQMSSDTDTRVVATRAGFTCNTVPDGATGKDITRGTIAFDTHGAWSGDEYVVQVSGIYRLSALISYQANWAAGEYWYANVRVNGSDVARITTWGALNTTTAGIFVDQSGSITLSVNAGDKIRVRIYQDNLSSITKDFSGALYLERLSGPATIAASETVAASYWLPSTQTSDSSTPLNFSSKEFDSHNAVTTGAAWRFSAPISGTYLVTGFVIQNTLILAGLLVYKNGSAYKAFGYGNGAGFTTNGSVEIKLNAGDYIDLRASASSSYSGAASLNSTGASHIDICRIGN